jgi:hypothetical protein
MRKRICHLLAVLAMVVWPAIGHALPNENGEYTKLGVGNLECGLWTQARQIGDVNAVWWKTLILGWVQGYLTGYNHYGPGMFDDPKGVGADIVTGWVDDYCVQHPLNNIAGAAEALVTDLQKPRKHQLPSSSTTPR